MKTKRNNGRGRFRVLCAVLCTVCTVLCAALGVGVVPAAAAPGSSAQGRSSGELPSQVYVGGMPFGVKFYTEGVLVVGFCDLTGTDGRTRNPAREAGLRVHDVITEVGGRPLSGAAELTAAVENSNGQPLTLTVRRVESRRAGRTGKDPSSRASGAAPATVTVTVIVKPQISKEENRFKTGLWVRDSGAGIGTVTFVVPSSRAFAGLGHGICDSDTGTLVPIGRGQVTDVTVSGIDKGVAGDPGAIKGYFTPGKTGTLIGNTPCGVFGVFASLPSGADSLMEVAPRKDVREGPATIRCTLDDGKIRDYAVRITSIDPAATDSKCFGITVTDPALLEKTGGIVQGMSGSPVIQNGRLVGAVTHVLINNPAAGYGIFIDNMWRDMPELLR